MQLLPAFPVLGNYVGLRVEGPAYLMYPFNLPHYGQVIQGGAGGAFMPRHVHTDQVQVLRKELKTSQYVIYLKLLISRSHPFKIINDKA